MEDLTGVFPSCGGTDTLTGRSTVAVALADAAVAVDTYGTGVYGSGLAVVFSTSSSSLWSSVGLPVQRSILLKYPATHHQDEVAMAWLMYSSGRERTRMYGIVHIECKYGTKGSVNEGVQPGAANPGAQLHVHCNTIHVI
jgi:hypothetical protein